MRWLRPGLVLMVGLAAMLLAALGSATGPAAASLDALAAARAARPLAPSPDHEAEFVADMNRTRRDAGLAPLTVDPSLTLAARGWASSMAERHVLEHADDIITGAPADWTKVGENVGRGGNVGSIWDAFMASPTHAANVLDPAYTRIGIGVVWSDDDVLYTAHRFAGAVSDRPVTPPVRTPTPPATPVPPPAEDPPTSLPFDEPVATPVAARVARTASLVADAF